MRNLKTSDEEESKRATLLQGSFDEEEKELLSSLVIYTRPKRARKMLWTQVTCDASWVDIGAPIAIENNRGKKMLDYRFASFQC